MKLLITNVVRSRSANFALLNGETINTLRIGINIAFDSASEESKSLCSGNRMFKLIVSTLRYFHL